MAPTAPKSTASKAAKAAKPQNPAKPQPAKPQPAKPRAAKAAPSRAAAEVGNAPAGAATVKLKDLVDSVATATGAKKPEARRAVEATLAALGSALSASASLTVPPLGKLRVVKAAAGTLTLKLRLAGAAQGKGLALAEDGGDD